MCDTIASEARDERCQHVEAAQRFAEAVDETVEGERGVVNERNVCSQERDKGRVEAARQRQQALFEERAHTTASIADSLPAALETARRSSRRSACVTRTSGDGVAHCRNCVTRREPWKLPSALSSNTGVKPIANTNRIVPAVGGEARDKRKRVTFADAVAVHVEPVAAVAAQL